MSLETVVSASEIILLFGEFLPKRNSLRNAIQSDDKLTMLSKYWLMKWCGMTLYEDVKRKLHHVTLPQTLVA